MGYWILAFLDKDLDHVGEEAISFFVIPRQRYDLCLDFGVLDKDLDHVGEEAIELGISALALGDGIHFPALVRLLGSSFPDRGRTYIVVFPFPDWDWDWARRLSISSF